MELKKLKSVFSSKVKHAVKHQVNVIAPTVTKEVKKMTSDKLESGYQAFKMVAGILILLIGASGSGVSVSTPITQSVTPVINFNTCNFYMRRT